MNQTTIDALALRLTIAVNNNADLIRQLLEAEPGTTAPSLDLSGVTAAAVALEATNEGLAITIGTLAPSAPPNATQPPAAPVSQT